MTTDHPLFNSPENAPCLVVVTGPTANQILTGPRDRARSRSLNLADM